MSKHRKDSGKNPSTLTKISTKIEFLDKNVNKINLALFGENGRGGMVKDLQEIKSSLKSATSIIKSLGVPIVIAVVAALITAYILKSIG